MARRAADTGSSLKRVHRRYQDPQAELRARALRLLGRRDYSRSELAQRLAPGTEGTEEVNLLLDEFERCGWLSEQRVAEQLVRAAAGRFGSCKVAQQLVARGVSEAVANEVLAGLREADLENGRRALRRRFPAAPANEADRSRQGRFLAGRGFTEDVIERLLGTSQA
ncbi:MAG: recombination regulator RecX [Proteobacteria bacterium]|nr:MAG: recombination regulator RecX [Pseudomonadota bacterium]